MKVLKHLTKQIIFNKIPAIHQLNEGNEQTNWFEWSEKKFGLWMGGLHCWCVDGLAGLNY